jgi:hypothetical protein
VGRPSPGSIIINQIVVKSIIKVLVPMVVARGPGVLAAPSLKVPTCRTLALCRARASSLDPRRAPSGRREEDDPRRNEDGAVREYVGRKAGEIGQDAGSGAAALREQGGLSRKYGPPTHQKSVGESHPVPFRTVFEGRAGCAVVEGVPLVGSREASEGSDSGQNSININSVEENVQEAERGGLGCVRSSGTALVAERTEVARKRRGVEEEARKRREKQMMGSTVRWLGQGKDEIGGEREG